MNNRANDHLERQNVKEQVEGALKEYTTAMKEQTIPEIEREIKRNEERAAELRFSPGQAWTRQRGARGEDR